MSIPRDLLDALPHAVWLSAPDGTPRYLNAFGRSYLGRPDDLELVVAWHDVLHPDDSEPARHELARAVASGVGYVAERRLRRADGAYRWHRVNLSAVHDEQGELTGWLCTHTDIHGHHAVREHATTGTDQGRLGHEQADLVRRSVRAASAERERLAGQLHDDVVQLLTAALLRLDLAAMSGDEGALAPIREPLDAAVRSLRRTMLELAPIDVTADGLATAIDAYIERLLGVDDVQSSLSVDLGDVADIPTATLLTAYRLVQEALTNVRRHANATRVDVRIQRIGNQLTGLVVDDGVGIDEHRSEQAGQLGLRLMRDRALVVGGSTRIRRRSPEGGTEVFWTLPLTDE